MIRWKTKGVQWLNAESEPVFLKDIIQKIDNDMYEIHVGCDSHFKGGMYVFAIVIAAYKRGNGGIYYFYRKKSDDKRLDNMKVRLLKETELAIAIADELKSKKFKQHISVHLDINPKKQFASSVVLTRAVSWVESSGYTPIVKPGSWASSCLADAYAK